MIKPPEPETALLYLGALVRKKDAEGNPTGEANMIFASPFFLDLDAWPIFARNTAISASRVIDAAVQGGAPEPKEVKIAIFVATGWKAARGFALIDGESLMGWQHATADGAVLIKAEHGDLAAQMLEQIRAAGAGVAAADFDRMRAMRP